MRVLSALRTYLWRKYLRWQRRRLLKRPDVREWDLEEIE